MEELLKKDVYLVNTLDVFLKAKKIRCSMYRNECVNVLNEFSKQIAELFGSAVAP